jgi:hypothetical protein
VNSIPQQAETSGSYGTPLPLQPNKKKIMHITRNRKNKTLAIPADAAAIPPNPNTAAISAIIRKVTAQPNISFTSLLQTESNQTNTMAVFSIRIADRNIGKMV